jgi:tetratricopeptide (TPR) repeat protein
MGRFDEARRVLDRSLALSGEQVSDRLSYARIAYFQRDFARSERELRGGDRSQRAWRVWYADAVTGTGRLAAAESILAGPGDDADDADVRLRRMELLARMGRVADARAQYRAAGDRGHDFPTLAAGALAALGDTAAAIAEIERAVEEHEPLVVDLAVDPHLDPLRANPRFVRILRDLRFPKIP